MHDSKTLPRQNALDYTGPAPVPARVRAPGLEGYCPWRHLGELEGVNLTWMDPSEPEFGLTDFETTTVSLRRGLSPAERRTTLAHELAHVERGPGCGPDTSARSEIEEYVVDVTAGLRLIPAGILERLPELVDRHGTETVGDVLEVDEPMVYTMSRLVERSRGWR